jgi:hypothetical protein
MYYEELRKHKIRKQIPKPEPELEPMEKEEKPIVVKA